MPSNPIKKMVEAELESESESDSEVNPRLSRNQDSTPSNLDSTKSKTESSMSEKEIQRLKMSKAMGALFLKDKVSRLESHVGQLEFKRDSAYSRGKGRGRGMAMGMGNSTGERGRGGSVKVTTGLQPSDLEVSRDENPSEFHERVSEEEEKRRGKEKERDLSNLPNIRILDSSVLIYSLRTVHEWLKKDQNVLIIPLEAVCILDELKKGDSPINYAARKAIRFLEERLSMNSTQSISKLDRLQTLIPGLYAQRESDRCSSDDLKERRKVIAESESKEQVGSEIEFVFQEEGLISKGQGHEISITSPKEEKFESISEISSTLGDPPRHIKSLLECCGYYTIPPLTSIFSSESLSSSSIALGSNFNLTVIIAYAPPTSETETSHPPNMFSNPNTTSTSKVNGNLTEIWLKVYGFSVLRVETASSWLGKKVVGHKFKVVGERQRENDQEKSRMGGISNRSSNYSSREHLPIQKEEVKGILKREKEGELKREKGKGKEREGEKKEGNAESSFRIW